MTLKFEPLDHLGEAVPGSRLFEDWLAGRLPRAIFADGRCRAAAELEQAFAATRSSGQKAAPFFADRGPQSWRQGMEEDLTNAADRDRFAADLESLSAGRATVVVTGQQPGWMGGPLYTLHKIATVIALARRLTQAGKPAVPVFWSGDDDDDLAEALAPVAWDAATGALKGPRPLPGLAGQRTTVGSLRVGSADWPDPGPQVSDAGAGSVLAADLVAIRRAAARAGLSWSVLQRRILLRMFTGTGLMIVSGNSTELHETAAPFYETLGKRLPDLAERARTAGRRLADEGWHAQIVERSLARPLFAVQDDRRQPVGPDDVLPAAAMLRPGVMLRSPVQDWLLQPAAVVVGPGELAYLRQLDGVYDALALERCPLVPRLFAWLLPREFDRQLLRNFRSPLAPGAEQATSWAREVAAGAADRLQALLENELGLDAERAAQLAGGRTRRWQKGLTAMLKDEVERVRLAGLPRDPAWVFPAGQRQERRLSFLNAAIMWGEDLIAGLLDAAHRHLEDGLRDDWHEYGLEVDDPGPAKGRPRP
jgi:hypothetical protein